MAAISRQFDKDKLFKLMAELNITTIKGMAHEVGVSRQGLHKAIRTGRAGMKILLGLVSVCKKLLDREETIESFTINESCSPEAK